MIANGLYDKFFIDSAWNFIVLCLDQQMHDPYMFETWGIFW